MINFIIFSIVITNKFINNKLKTILHTMCQRLNGFECLKKIKAMLLLSIKQRLIYVYVVYNVHIQLN